jgi:hypothetical protein
VALYPIHINSSENTIRLYNYFKQLTLAVVVFDIDSYYIYPDEYRIEVYIVDYLINIIVVFEDNDSLQIASDLFLDGNLYSNGMIDYRALN